MNDAPYRICGIGLIAPEIDTLAQLGDAARTRKPGTAPSKVAAIPPPEGMTPREQRRMARLTKLALCAADRCRKTDTFTEENTGLYVGVTHGPTGFLKEFHDYLIEYGPEMCSPNAFSNGLSNAPLSSVSKVMNIRGGGFTLVDYENCGLKALATATVDLDAGIYENCCIGAVEEYSELIEQIYRSKGLYCKNGEPPFLPCPEGTGIGVAEGSVFISLRRAGSCTTGCGYQPINDPSCLSEPADVIISAATATRYDASELDLCKMLRDFGHGHRGILFSKAFLGETFGASALFSLAAGYDMIVNGSRYTQYPVHPDLKAVPGHISGVTSVLISGCDRNGEYASALLTR